VKKLQLKRSYILFIHDILLSLICFVLSWAIRFIDQIHALPWDAVKTLGIEFLFVSSLILFYSGIHKRSWRYSTERDYLKLFQTAMLINIAFFVIKFFMDRLELMPRSLLIINTILFSLGLLASRIIYKYIVHLKFGSVFSVTKLPVLIAGIDDRVELFLRENTRTQFYKIVGIVDEDLTRKGSSIYGVKILGPLARFSKIYEKLKSNLTLPRRIIISDKYATKSFLDQLSNVSDTYGIKLARLPNLTELDYSLKESKNLKPIIIEDLLVRDQSLVGAELVQDLIKNSVVLVTGAGGTIGHELSRQISSLGPKKIILLENSEYNLYNVYENIKKYYPTVKSEHYVADVRNFNLCNDIFNRTKPDFVFHAAALKHVPIVESNFSEGITVNMMGTKNIADLAMKHCVKSMILISTDKAVDPSSIMGATKRAAEMYLKAIENTTGNKNTKFTAVRFGNVLGSSGSVIPLFKRQISEGGPITVTDPKMKRYFMTVREAVKLVLQAASYGYASPKQNNLYILDMGEQVYIKDLAKNMIEMAGLELDKDIKIQYTGLRPGEKLSENLFNKNEKYIKTESKDLFVVEQTDVIYSDINNIFEKLDKLLNNKPNNREEALRLLKSIVKNYESANI